MHPLKASPPQNPARLVISSAWIERDGIARVSGFGFLPGSLVHIWIFSDPVCLGALTVTEDGTFAGPMSLLGIPEGEHTLQVNGISFDGAERTADPEDTLHRRCSYEEPIGQTT